MLKIFSLLKAAASEDMNLFRVKSSSGPKLNKFILPLVLAFVILSAVGSYAYMLAEALAPSGKTYVMLTLFIVAPALLTLIEGIYKSQGILFDAKDNDLLFSLPLKKSEILFVRLFKLMAFQFLYSALFMLPAFVVYALFETPAPSFYFVSLLMLILSPILPTILGAFLGYLVKSFSARFKAKNLVQVLATSVVLLLVFYLSLNLQGALALLVENAESVNGVMAKIYYPAALYLNLIQDFRLLDLIILLAINLVPLVVFIYAASLFYFKIISKTAAKSGTKKVTKKSRAQKPHSPTRALMKKELNRFFSSPVFIINAGFGLLLIVVVTFALVFNADGFISMLLENEELNISADFIKSLLPKIFFALVTFMLCMTSITSSMISLEGKSMNITKSLPVSPLKILLAKVLTSNLIAIPLVLLCDLIFFCVFRVPPLDILFILLATFLVPTFTAFIGLLVNLKYPKMHATSDTEIVKQSMSGMVAVFIGMFVGMFSAAVLFLAGEANLDLAVALELLAFALAILILYRILKTYGVKRWRAVDA